MSDSEEDRFVQAKNALLAHYSSQQTSQSARLVGFVIVFLTLLQATDSRIQRLFPNLASFFGTLVPADWDWLRFPFFIVLVTLLIASTIYTLGRFSVFAQLSQEVMYVTYLDVKERGGEKSLHESIHALAWSKLVEDNPKLLGVFKVRWFASTGTESQNLIGLGCSIIIGVFLALVLTWLLW